MNKILPAALALAMVASSAGVAAAQPHGRNDHRHEQREERKEERKARKDDRKEYREELKEARKEARRESQWERRAERRYSAERYQAPRGYAARTWRRGDRLPSAYRSRAYVVDYNRYGLRAPPRGYQYVRVDNDVILTQVATGVIASVVFDLFN